MQAELPLAVHTELPRRLWDRRFRAQPAQETRLANQELVGQAEKIRAAYERLLVSEQYRFLTGREVDPLILPFVTALSRMPYLRPWQSCQGLYHSPLAGASPTIGYHPLTDVQRDPNPCDNCSPISGSACGQESDLAKIAEFLGYGPQDTFYPWQVVGSEYYGRLQLKITIPGLEMDPDFTTAPLVPEGVALHPLSQAVYDRVVKDVNSLTLGLLLFQETYGLGLEGFPPPGYYD